MAKKKIKYIKRKPTLATCCIVSVKDRIYMIDFSGKEISVGINPRITDNVFHVIVRNLQEKFSEIFNKAGVLEKLTDEAIKSMEKFR